MWDTLINIIENRWKERPRKNLVSAIVKLRTNMENCQKWYDEFQIAKKKGNIESIPYPNPKVEWTRSLGYLSESILELDSVLKIFTPEAHKLIYEYQKAESLEFIADESFKVIESEIKEFKEFDLKAEILQPTFKNAIGKLDEFIRGNFKPEEIQSAMEDSLW